MSGEGSKPPVQPAVPPPRKPAGDDRTTVVALATVGLFCPPLWFLAPVAVVLAHTEIRDLQAKGDPAPLSLRAARAMGIIGCTLLGFVILCWAGHLAG